ncbi:hypothetical protein BWO91_17610 [Plantibacter flavus]|uniref:SIR2 family NAD-dependent protein deacylase n=1 Tax=Plantibacter flavus TaxID=150123 RepID=UPI00099D6730|nr:SIR2 family protein [Plantibacter flavus]AQX81538.1 hypothetical protein BWO91_17610 [Plantibacter flavus]
MEQRLKSALERKNLVFIVGTGFSAATTDGQAASTWRGLIEDGVREATALGTKPGWEVQVRASLDYGFEQDDMDAVLSAASGVFKELNRHGDYVVPKWLKETVGQLTPIKDELAKRLRALPYPLLTTNYDTLLENNDRRGTDWTRPVEMQHVLAGVESRDVGHLHGRWNNPDSVIFTERQYDLLLESDAAQALQKAASTLKSLVYVGFGAGLGDPNFGQLIAWHRSNFIPSAVDHFRLCRESELEELRVLHSNDQIVPVSYGENYDDLPAFLAQFAAPESVELTSAGIVRDVVSEAQNDFADDMRQDSILADTLDSVIDRPVSDVILPPVLLPVPHAEYIKARSSKREGKIDRLDPREEVTHGDILIVAAEENTGLTTAIKWMTLEAANYLSGASPLYIQFGSCRKRSNPLTDAVQLEALRHQLIQQRGDELPPYVLGLDNFSPFVDRLSDATLEEISSSDALLTIIGCVQGTEEEVVDRLARLGSKPRVRYVGKLSAADVREYARIASPTDYLKLAEQVLLMLQAENLPKTPFTVSLMISVLVQGGKFAANASQTSILDDYIGLLLGRGDPHEDARFGLDQTAREALLGGLAQNFVEKGVGGESEVAVQASFESTFDKFGWDESTSEVLKSFLDRKILRRRGNHIEFARSSFLHIFAAKRATTDPDFRLRLLERPLYYSDAITDYAALYRHDADLLSRLSVLLQPDGEPHQRSGVFEPLELAQPRLDSPEPLPEPEHQESPEPAATEIERSADTGWKDVLFDSEDDEDLPPFPTVHEDEVPESIQLLRTLELVSTVLRDSDQVEALGLKQQLLHDVLDRWADTMDVIHDDNQFLDFVVKLITDLGIGKSDGSDRDEVIDEYGRAIPAAIVMSAVGTTLASRKLTKILDRVLRDEGNPISEEAVVIACFFQYSLAERGWPGRVSDLLRQRGNIWIIRNFLLRLLMFAYETDEVHASDADELLDLCLMIIEQASKYKDEPERRSHLTKIKRDIEQRRLKSRVRQSYTSSALQEGS